VSYFGESKYSDVAAVGAGLDDLVAELDLRLDHVRAGVVGLLAPLLLEVQRVV